ncbi:hypothetical protein AYI69_g10688 [Smittium culicis]|uniref:Uncharacterized protein n=1 Tax=Smittium culicis TaxID=133412 RepID=A0A1R1X436_9FUNG|nr:hypothetical protein AYI69_g10688 [Smittium culicis]
MHQYRMRFDSRPVQPQPIPTSDSKSRPSNNSNLNSSNSPKVLNSIKTTSNDKISTEMNLVNSKIDPSLLKERAIPQSSQKSTTASSNPEKLHSFVNEPQIVFFPAVPRQLRDGYMDYKMSYFKRKELSRRRKERIILASKGKASSKQSSFSLFSKIWFSKSSTEQPSSDRKPFLSKSKSLYVDTVLQSSDLNSDTSSISTLQPSSYSKTDSSSIKLKKINPTLNHPESTSPLDLNKPPFGNESQTSFNSSPNNNISHIKKGSKLSANLSPSSSLSAPISRYNSMQTPQHNSSLNRSQELNETFPPELFSATSSPSPRRKISYSANSNSSNNSEQLLAHQKKILDLAMSHNDESSHISNSESFNLYTSTYSNSESEYN